jgi:hypothetical protein
MTENRDLQATNPYPPTASAGIVKIVDDIYQDLFRGYVRGVGEGLALYGQAFKEKVQRRLKSIPDDRRKDPPLRLGYETVQGGILAGDEPTLQDMFANLLASASDKERADDVHPSFPEKIRSMSRHDALFMKYLGGENGMQIGGIRI